MLIACGVITSCSDRKEHVLIQGKMENSNSELVVISEITPKKIVQLDSTIIDKEGSFNFEIQVPQTGFYVIHIGRNSYIRLQVEQKDEIQIFGDLDDNLSTYTVSGSEASEMLSLYNRVTAGNKKLADSLGQIFLDQRHMDKFTQVREQIDSNYRAIFDKQFYFTAGVIEDNAHQLASLLLINEYFGRTPLFNEKDNLDYFLLLDSVLYKNYPNNQHAQDHHKRVQDFHHKKDLVEKARERFGVGNYFPDLNLPDRNGEMKSLYSEDGELVLVHIWSALNAKGRKQNNDLAVLYKDFHEKGFRIYSISLDNNLSLWKNALKVDQMEWTCVCDGKGMNSPLVDLFALEKLPVSFLLDENKKIIDTNLSFEELIENIRKLN